MSCFLNEAFIKFKYYFLPTILLFVFSEITAQPKETYTLLWEVSHKDFKRNDTYFDYDGSTDDWEQRGKELIDSGEPY